MHPTATPALPSVTLNLGTQDERHSAILEQTRPGVVELPAGLLEPFRMREVGAREEVYALIFAYRERLSKSRSLLVA